MREGAIGRWVEMVTKAAAEHGVSDKERLGEVKCEARG